MAGQRHGDVQQLAHAAGQLAHGAQRVRRQAELPQQQRASGIGIVARVWKCACARLQCRAVSMFSSTVMCRHSCGIWKERATPRRVISRASAA